MPPTWPMVQLFGSGFGQEASTAKVGMSPAWAAGVNAGAAIRVAAAMQAKRVFDSRAAAGIERTR